MNKVPRPKPKPADPIKPKITVQETDNKPVTPKKHGKGNVTLTQPNTTPETPKKKKPRKQSRDPKGSGKRR